MKGFLITIFFISYCVHSLNLPSTWQKVTLPFKNKAREWFIGRAESVGIPWTNLKNYYSSPLVNNELLKNKINVTDRTIEYPSYYTKPFHGYDKGNLNWLAAQEAEAATLNIASGYWPYADVETAQAWMRTNTTDNVKLYFSGYNCNIIDDIKHVPTNHMIPRKILDIGCSIGYSTESYKKAFPESKIWGLDLSPYFLSVATYRKQKLGHNIDYIHANAENIPFEDEYMNLVTCNFLFHEVPLQNTQNILQEVYRVLSPNGIVAITDIEPDIVNNRENNLLTPFRKWMFEITEPHIFSYYENDMKTLLREAGFSNIVKSRNDPVNSIWIAKK